MQFLYLFIPAPIIPPRSTPTFLPPTTACPLFFNSFSLFYTAHIFWGMRPPPGLWLIDRSHTLEKMDCLTNSYHLTIVPQLKVGLCASLSPPGWRFYGLSLCRSWACWYNCCESICTSALLCPYNSSIAGLQGTALTDRPSAPLLGSSLSLGGRGCAIGTGMNNGGGDILVG
jgi:hypothetical protein